MVDLVKLKKQLSDEEGRKYKPYVDTRGKLSIGIGRNLWDIGLRDSEIDFLFGNDVVEVENDIQKYLPWVLALDDVRQRVFYDLCFNMGIKTLLEFENTLSFAKELEFDQAADELKNSKWYGQVGQRGPKLVAMLRTGADI